MEAAESPVLAPLGEAKLRAPLGVISETSEDFCRESSDHSIGAYDACVVTGAQEVFDEKTSILTLMEQVYRDIRDESAKPDIRLHKLADSLPQREDSLTLELLAKFSVLESAVAFFTSPTDPMTSKVMREFAHEFPRLDSEAKLDYQRQFFDESRCRRYGAFAIAREWTLLSILAHCTSFRNAAFNLGKDYWDAFMRCILDNKISLEIFAKVRNLDIEVSLVRVKHFISLELDIESLSRGPKLPTITPGLHHTCIVRETVDLVERKKFQGRLQSQIPGKIYDPALFKAYDQPEHWPSNKPYPSDPTLRDFGKGTCASCGNREMCHCDPNTCSGVLRPLVELRDYGSKGTGIRALQRIRNGAILGEYVGEIRATRDRGDPVYNMSIDLLDAVPNRAVASIHAKRFGNWTRFMNHSCRPVACFLQRVIGDRVRVMVVATRDVDMFEEITVDYGDAYWTGSNCCECGEDYCRLSLAYKKAHP